MLIGKFIALEKNKEKIGIPQLNLNPQSHTENPEK